MSIALSMIAKIDGRLRAAAWGSKRAIVEDEATRLKVSVNTLYGELRKFRGTKRKRRADHGQAKRLDENAFQAVARIKAKGTDKLNGRRIPTDVAIEIAERNGMIEPGSVARGTFDRHARQKRSFGPPRLYSRFQAERSNQLHHVDSSGSKYLRVLNRLGNGDWLIGVRRPEYSRKRKEEPFGLWATNVVDDRSRIAFATYDVAPGESARMVADALTRAWSGDPRCALKGIPDQLYCDHGPFKRSQEGEHFCETLGVFQPPRTPKTPWSGGKVERPWRTFIQRFELPFLTNESLQITLTELNRRLDSYSDECNKSRHPFYQNQTRLRVYEDALDPSTVRYVPEGMDDAMWREDWRKIALDGTVRYHNTFYVVSDEIAGRYVRVLRSRDGCLVVKCEDETYPMKEFKPHDVGTYRAKHFSPAQWLDKEAQDLPACSLPHAEPGQTLHLHSGPTAEIQTPFMREEAIFANRAEAELAVSKWLGKPVHTLPIEIQKALHELLTNQDMLRESVLQEFAANLRAKLA